MSTTDRHPGRSTPAIDFGSRQLVLRSPGGRASYRIGRRLAIFCAAAVVCTLGLLLVSLMTGAYALSPGEVLGALTGHGEGLVPTVVLQWRLPRALLAVLFGWGLGVAGAIFQSLTRNPLGSPDIIGFDAGAFTGALLVMFYLHGGTGQRTVGALVGGIGTAAVVYLLAYRRGVHGYRLIVVGIGVTAMIGAFNSWLILSASTQDAISASFWGAGSLNGTGYRQLITAAIAFAVLLPAAAALAPTLRMLELGDDAGRQLGVSGTRSRFLLVLMGVGLSATVTALVGPIAFIALAAPQIGRRLAGTAGVSLLAAAITGGVLLLTSDWLAQHAIAGGELPAGVVTVVLGGGNFVWLLISEARKK